MRHLLLLLTLLTAPALAARPPAEAEVDRVALAALLVRDGHWDRASQVLDEVDPGAKGLDVPRYWTLVGLVHLSGSRPAEAAKAFQAALDAGADDAMVRVQLAQAHLTAGDPDASLAALDGDPVGVAAVSQAWLVRSRAEWSCGQPDAAWSALDRGATAFPEAQVFDRERVLRLVELGLFREAEERAQEWLQRAGEDPEAWLTLAEAYRQGGSTRDAVVLLEQARLRFPGEVSVLVQLAGSWLALDTPLACGQVLQEAAQIEPRYALEAAECYRRAGATSQALYLNAQVPDATQKTRQRLGLLLEAADYDRVVALEPRLERLGLLEDDGVSYALAYAWYLLGDLDAVEARLKGIEDPEVFRDAMRLRRAMESCREAPETCS